MGRYTGLNTRDWKLMKITLLQDVSVGYIFSLYFGSQLVTVLCGYRSIKDAFSRDALMGRPLSEEFELSQETKETAAISGVPWKEQRKFSLHSLRNLGFGKTQMECHIKEEIVELLGILKNEGSKPISVSKFLSPSTSNNIASLVFGCRRKFDDPIRIMFDDSLDKIGKLIGKAMLFPYFPILREILLFLHYRPLKELKSVFVQFKDYISEEIRDHQKTIDTNNARDYIDSYILEIEKRKSDPKTSFQIPVLRDLVSLFFGAGSRTISNALDWMLLITAAYPSVQKRVQSEIDAVLGRDKFPTRSDHHDMLFTEAVIMETLRWKGSFPINLPRYTLEDVRIGPYCIPKGSYVIAVFWAVHHDPELWGADVDEFKPERFLSADGKEIRKPEYFLPFSSGKRSCPGEPLAYVELFLYYTAILQKFNLKFPEGVVPDLEGILGFGFHVTPYQLCLELRQ